MISDHILNVKYVIREKEGNTNAIENPNNLGVAWFADKLIFEENPDSVYMNLLKYDLRETAIIENKNQDIINYSNERRISQIELLKNKTHKKIYSIKSNKPGFVVFSLPIFRSRPPDTKRDPKALLFIYHYHNNKDEKHLRQKQRK